MKRFSKNHVKVMNTYSNNNNQNKIYKNQNLNLKLKSNDIQNNYLKNENQSQGGNQETRNFEALSSNYKLSNDDLYYLNEISPSYKSSLTEYDDLYSSESGYNHRNNFNNKLFFQTPKNLFKKTESITNKNLLDYKNDNALSDNKIIKVANNNKKNNNLTISINDTMNNNVKNVNNTINNNITNKNIDKNIVINNDANIKEVGRDSKVNLDDNYNMISSNTNKDNYNNNKFHNIVYSKINNDTIKDNYTYNNKNSNINKNNNSNNSNNNNNNNSTNNSNNNNNINNNNEYYKNSLNNNINENNNNNIENHENNENNIDGYNNDLIYYNNYDEFNNIDSNYNYNNDFNSDNNLINYDSNNNEYVDNEYYYNYDDYNNNNNYDNNNNDYSNRVNYTEYSNNKLNNNEFFDSNKYNNVNVNDNNNDYNKKESHINDNNNFSVNNDFANDISNNYKYKYVNTDIENNISNINKKNSNINNDYMNNTSQNNHNNKNLFLNNFANNHPNKNEDSIKNYLNIITDFNRAIDNKNYNERNSNRIKTYCQTNIKKSSFKEFKNILKKHRKNFIKDYNQFSETNISHKNSNKNSFNIDVNKYPDFSQSDKANINIRINNNLGRPLYVKRRYNNEERIKINSEKKLIEQYKENRDSNARNSNYIYKSPETKTNVINDFSNNKSLSTNKRDNKYFLNKFNSYNNINFLSVNVSNKKEEFQTPKINEKILPIRNKRKDIKSMPKMKEYNSFNYSDKNTFRIYNSSKTNTMVSATSKITDRYIDSYNFKANINKRRNNIRPGYKITKRNNDDIKNSIKIVSFTQRRLTHNTHHSEIKITSSFSPNKSSFYNNTGDFNNHIKITSSFSPNHKNNTNSNNEIKNAIKINETFSPSIKRKRPGNRLNSGLTIISCFSQSNKNNNKYTNKIRINKMITIKNNLNQNQIINTKTNNIVINHNIKLSNINKKTSEKQTEIDKFNKYINFGKSLLSKISRKKCDKCNKFIDSHLFKIHYNSHPTEIFNWLYLGTFANACDIKELRRMKINYILNVANECNNKNLPKDIKELHLNIKDSEYFEISTYFDEANEFINKCKSEGGILLVHCKLGISRSASFILAYLIKYHKLTLENALEFVKQKRNQIKPNEGFMKQLYEYEKLIRV